MPKPPQRTSSWHYRHDRQALLRPEGGDLWQVTLRGLDVFDPASMETRSLQGDDVPCRMLDTDYDGQCFRAVCGRGAGRGQGAG